MMQYIRPWRLTDAGDIARALNNKRIQDNLRDGLPFPYTEADGLDYIRHALDAPADSQYLWAIHVDDVAVGSIGIHRKENIHYRTAELGYYLAEAHWGKGIVTAAVKEACDTVFAQTDMLRIFAEPFAHNTASRRVLEKAGFTLEGILQKNAVKNGTVVDMALYALIKE
ncbi:GNAT family N-acetyltransferase [Eubacteriales bacterium OttesenSCG-928-M02]|nr:GNAT family N-acetyltransferase [Eubacteriales bacterium OttesenSCG-928-M02]